MRKHRLACCVGIALCVCRLPPSGWARPTLIVREGAGWQYALSRSEGESDLRGLSRTAPTEDAWLCLGSAWLDIGHAERAKSVEIDLEAAASDARTIMLRTVTAASVVSPPVFYHIHLFRSDARSVDPPSAPDIHALARLKHTCRQMLGAELTGALFDGRGEWIFDISGELEQGLVESDAKRSGGEGGLADYAFSKGYVRGPHSAASFDFIYPEIVWESMLEEAAPAREKRISRFIEEAGKLGVWARYLPLPE
jgi:hypothetical protein